MNCPMGGEAAAQPEDVSIPGDPVMISDAQHSEPAFELDGDCWREEVAARLQRYRTRRRPRPPRYPSLRLPFEPLPAITPAHSRDAVAHAPTAQELASCNATAAALDRAADYSIADAAPAAEPEPFSNVIEFPRTAIEPVMYVNSLAEPILDRPRIVEAPEVCPPPPALGGLLLDPVSGREPEVKTAPLVISPASIGSRMLSSAIDVLVISAAIAAFVGMFYWTTSYLPPRPIFVVASAVLVAVAWSSYQLLFVVHAAATPGMWLARLQLLDFGGSAVGRKRRRWRVFASYMSAASLGLGYLWCLLDENGLCWHDRMTRTMPVTRNRPPE